MVKNISVVGLGKLGSCFAATLANAGFQVTGIDIDSEKIDAMNDGEAPYPEPKLEGYLRTASDRFRATQDYTCIEDTDVTFIVVNTPSTEEGRFSLAQVETVLESIGPTLATKDRYHVVGLVSTVHPGSTMGPVKNQLEASTGKTVGEELGLCYSPEFIAIGDIIDGLENPDFFLIGEQSTRAGDVLEEIYRQINNTVPVARLNPTTAEITKMAVNAYVTMKISFANTLAQVCNGTGGDVDEVTETLAHDSRISGAYFTGGARFGGPCFPRDNRAFSTLAEDAGTRAPLAESTDEVNDLHTEWIADLIRTHKNTTQPVGILGLSYKPNTFIAEESQGVQLVEELSGERKVLCFDPMAMEDAREDLEHTGTVSFVADAAEAVNQATTVVLSTRWDEFLNPDLYRGQDVTLIDLWRVFDEGTFADDDVTYVPVGRRRDRYTEPNQWLSNRS